MKIYGNKNVITFVFITTFLFLGNISIGILLLAYSPLWYSVQWQNNAASIEMKKKSYAIEEELPYYFLYQQPLSPAWNAKEKQHFQEVRTWYTRLALYALVYVLLIPWFLRTVKKKLLRGALLLNMSLLALLQIILGFSFRFFWNRIFHPLLFANDLWKLKPDELSYALFPLPFFQNSVFLILWIALLLSFVMYLVVLMRSGK